LKPFKPVSYVMVCPERGSAQIPSPQIAMNKELFWSFELRVKDGNASGGSQNRDIQ